MSGQVKQKQKVVPAFSLERCKRCGICTHFCPTEAIAPDAEGVPVIVDRDACTSCRLCEHLCPDFAISMVPVDDDTGVTGDQGKDREAEHPPGAPEVCHPFGACDG